MKIEDLLSSCWGRVFLRFHVYRVFRVHVSTFLPMVRALFDLINGDNDHSRLI